MKKILKKLCQTMMSMVLVLSMFLGTGITKASAETLDWISLQNKNEAVKAIVAVIKTTLPSYVENEELKNWILSIDDRAAIIDRRMEDGIAYTQDELYLTNVLSVMQDLKSWNDGFKNLISKFSTIEEALNLLGQENEKVYYDNDIITNITNIMNGLKCVKESTPICNSLNNLKTLIASSEELADKYEGITAKERGEYKTFFNILHEEYILSTLNGALGDNPTLETYTSLQNNVVKLSSEIRNVGLGTLNDTINNIISSTDLKVFKINGININTTLSKPVMYVGNEVTEVEVVAIAKETNTTLVRVEKPDTLLIGSNEVRVVVTALNGTTKEYIVEVIRLDVEKVEIVPVVEPTIAEPEEIEVVPVENEATEEPEAEDITTQNDKTDETEEEEEKVNAFTILLIVGGIGLIVPNFSEVKKPVIKDYSKKPDSRENKNTKQNKNQKK